jgi:hypothetical protein
MLRLFRNVKSIAVQISEPNEPFITPQMAAALRGFSAERLVLDVRDWYPEENVCAQWAFGSQMQELVIAAAFYSGLEALISGLISAEQSRLLPPSVHRLLVRWPCCAAPGVAQKIGELLASSSRAWTIGLFNVGHWDPREAPELARALASLPRPTVTVLLSVADIEDPYLKSVFDAGAVPWEGVTGSCFISHAITNF